MAVVPEQRSQSAGPTLHERWLDAVAQEAARQGEGLPEPPPEMGESPFAWARRVGVSESVVAKASAQLFEIPYTESLSDYRAAASFLFRFPIGFAREHAVLALVGEAGELFIAMPSSEAAPIADTVARALDRHPTPLFAPRDEIIRAINVAYEQQSSQAETVLNSMTDNVGGTLSDANLRADLLETQGQRPVVELVNVILLDAVKAGASDVHLQPYREKLVVRFRIDGRLFDAQTVPKAIQDEMISRIKVMGKMNIAEKRLPQDGRTTVTVGEKLIDLRIASLPGSYGERVVLRLLDKSARMFTLREVGMDETTYGRFRELIVQEHGLILLTGPTGSGKTTTLYSALSEINTNDQNVVTLEDPIEYDIEGISQTQINAKKGLTFASGLRHVLRQDPDIIMVGEIRDRETAIMAIQSSLTGHLVFSTLHTNDAASAVTRLFDLGIEPYLVSSSLLAVLAQRLVRKVCPECAVSRPFTAEDRAQLGIGHEGPKIDDYRMGEGCEACRNTGYRGRVAICELLIIEDSVRAKIQARANASDIREAGLECGMRLLRDNGVDNILAGITTPSEVMRVTVRSRL